MKKNKKLLVLAALFLAVFAVGGTLAYLTDTSESATNTFTFGKVDITLTEPTWTSTGETAAGDVAPGQEIDKDPTITVANDSKNAYVFAKVTIPTGTVGGVSNQELFTLGTLGSGWVEITSSLSGLGAGVHVYAYGTASAMTAATAGATLPAVFTKITPKAALTETEIANLTGRSADVVVNAYAIQADGLKDGNNNAITAPAAVWAALGV